MAPKIDKLVEQATSDNVTVDKIAGKEKYFPDMTKIFEWPLYIEEEVPEYIVLLTNKGNYVRSHPIMGESEKKGHREGALVLTNRAIHYGAYHREFPYDVISRVNGSIGSSSGSIEIWVDGFKHKFNTARSGDEENAKEALAFLRQQVYLDE